MCAVTSVWNLLLPCGGNMSVDFGYAQSLSCTGAGRNFGRRETTLQTRKLMVPNVVFILCSQWYRLWVGACQRCYWKRTHARTPEQTHTHAIVNEHLELWKAPENGHWCREGAIAGSVEGGCAGPSAPSQCLLFLLSGTLCRCR